MKDEVRPKSYLKLVNMNNENKIAPKDSKTIKSPLTSMQSKYKKQLRILPQHKNSHCP